MCGQLYAAVLAISRCDFVHVCVLLYGWLHVYGCTLVSTSLVTICEITVSNSVRFLKIPLDSPGKNNDQIALGNVKYIYKIYKNIFSNVSWIIHVFIP